MMRTLSAPKSFYVRTCCAMAPDGGEHQLLGTVYGSLAEATKHKVDRDGTKLMSMEFVPLPTNKRFRVAAGTYSPPGNLGDLTVFRWLARRERLPSKSMRKLETLNREYRQALRALPLPRSYVQASPQPYVNVDLQPQQPLMERAEALAEVARINETVVRRRGERSKGIYCPWALLVEVAEPLGGPLMECMTIDHRTGVGAVEASIIQAVRVVHPTAEELAAYSIDWTQHARIEV